VVSTDVDGYLAGLPEDVRARVQALREAIAATVPGVGEPIRCGTATRSRWSW
jgi:uncharacterized protein YdhG (YjbR/CyaY superfamily)